MESINIISSLQTLVQKYCSKEDLSEFLYKHRCFYLLERIDEGTLKQKIILQKELNEQIVRERYRQCKEVFYALNNKVKYANIKGAMLSLAAYGNAAYRFSADIDILIDRNQTASVKEILSRHGFVQGKIVQSAIKPYSREELLFYSAFSHQMAPFVKKTESQLCPFIIFDINTDIMWGESFLQVDMNFVLSNITATIFCDVPMYKLDNEMCFISLCLHHYKDMNSIYILAKKQLQLSYFCDIYFYYVNNPLSISRLLAMCNKLGVSEYIYYCVYYTYQIFHDKRLFIFLENFEPTYAPEIIHTFGLSKNEIKLWTIDFYERVFGDLHSYLEKRLTQEDWYKIEQNSRYISG